MSDEPGFGTTEESCTVASSELRQALFRIASGACSLSPHPQNPTWVGLVLRLPPHGLLSKPQGSGALGPAGGQHPTLPHPVGPSVGLCRKGQEGPGVRLL